MRVQVLAQTAACSVIQTRCQTTHADALWQSRRLSGATALAWLYRSADGVFQKNKRPVVIHATSRASASRPSGRIGGLGRRAAMSAGGGSSHSQASSSEPSSTAPWGVPWAIWEAGGRRRNSRRDGSGATRASFSAESKARRAVPGTTGNVSAVANLSSGFVTESLADSVSYSLRNASWQIVTATPFEHRPRLLDRAEGPGHAPQCVHIVDSSKPRPPSGAQRHVEHSSVALAVRLRRNVEGTAGGAEGAGCLQAAVYIGEAATCGTASATLVLSYTNVSNT